MDEFLKNKFFVVLSIIAFFLLGFMTFAFTNDAGTFVDNTAGTVITPVQNGAGGILGFGKNIIERLTQFNKIKAENEQLRQKNAQYETDIAKTGV